HPVLPRPALLRLGGNGGLNNKNAAKRRVYWTRAGRAAAHHQESEGIFAGRGRKGEQQKKFAQRQHDNIRTTSSDMVAEL
ncbi:MAG: hypothetical protein D8H97_20760, partial [Neisseria sp.]